MLSVLNIFAFRYDAKTDKLGMSYARFKTSQMNSLGALAFHVFRILRIVDVKYEKGEDGEYVEMSNLTLINLVLKFVGPTNEGKLTKIMLSLQVSVCV